MSVSVPWRKADDVPESYFKNVLVLLKDNTVRYGYFTGHDWWIYSHNNGFIVCLEREVQGWKPLQ